MISWEQWPFLPTHASTLADVNGPYLIGKTQMRNVSKAYEGI